MNDRIIAYLPEQHEIDAIAHFVEAARSLKDSPFFTEEYMSLGLSYNSDRKVQQFRFPDKNVQEAVLLSFRKMWLDREPSNYMNVTNILKRYSPAFCRIVGSFIVKKDDLCDSPSDFPRTGLSCKDVIDMWLNTRYMHAGKRGRTGRFDRRKFEETSRQIGHEAFEFCFLKTVFKLGVCFLNLLQFAELFLAEMTQRGLPPSFIVEENVDCPTIDRRTPGFTPQDNSLEHCVWRLRRRRVYDGLAGYLNFTNCPDQYVAEVILRCVSFDDFMAEQGMVFEHADSLEAFQQPGELMCVSDDHNTVLKNGRVRKGALARYGNRHVMIEECLDILRDQYAGFRKALMSDSTFSHGKAAS